MEHLRKHKLSLGSMVCGTVLILGGGLLIIGGLLGWIISILAQKVFRRR